MVAAGPPGGPQVAGAGAPVRRCAGAPGAGPRRVRGAVRACAGPSVLALTNRLLVALRAL